MYQALGQVLGTGPVPVELVVKKRGTDNEHKQARCLNE